MFHSCGGGGGSAGGGDVSRGQGRRCMAHSVENGEGEAWVLRAGVLSRCEGPFVVEVEAEVERHVRHYHENTVRRIGDLHGNGRWSGGLSLREP